MDNKKPKPHIEDVRIGMVITRDHSVSSMIVEGEGLKAMSFLSSNDEYVVEDYISVINGSVSIIGACVKLEGCDAWFKLDMFYQSRKNKIHNYLKNKGK